MTEVAIDKNYSDHENSWLMVHAIDSSVANQNSKDWRQLKGYKGGQREPLKVGES